MKRPIFILGAHKSGSSLLRSLFDHHQDLFAIPFETHIFQNAGYWVQYRLRRVQPKSFSLDKIAENYVKQVEVYNSEFDPYSDTNLVGKFNIPKLRKALRCEKASFRELVNAYIQGIYSALFNSDLPSYLRIVEKSVEHAEFALDIKNLFPDSKFLHVVRNPYANLTSIRLVWSKTSKRNFPFLRTPLAGLINTYYYLYRNKRLIENYMVIRYEDLLLDPTNSMKEIAEFLAIEFSEDLLIPTIAGRPWLGNSSRGIPFTGISATNLNKWQNEVSDLEIQLVNKFIGFVLDDYGYQRITPNKSFYYPVRGESPIIYLANRLLPIYL